MKRRIVSDSSADIFALDGADFAAVPLKIITPEREFVDAPGLDIPQMLEYLMAYTGRSGTSCPNVTDWLAAFEGADEIFAVTITSALSGSNAMALQAREEYLRRFPTAKVLVIDSLSTGPEMLLLVEKLRELIGEGRSFEDIQAAIEEYQTHTRLLFALESLKNLANNGRVSHTTAKLAGLLGIRLIGAAGKDGTLRPLHKPRGVRHTVRQLIQSMGKAGFSGGKVRIAHSINHPVAAELARLIGEAFGPCDIRIHPCAGLCSYYAEKGGLLIGFEIR